MPSSLEGVDSFVSRSRKLVWSISLFAILFLNCRKVVEDNRLLLALLVLRAQSSTTTTPPSSSKEIQTFSLGYDGNTYSSTSITSTAIRVSVPLLIPINSLTLNFTTNGRTVSVDGSAVSSGTSTIDLTSFTKTIVVTAEDASTRGYTLTLTRRFPDTAQTTCYSPTNLTGTTISCSGAGQDGSVTDFPSANGFASPNSNGVYFNSSLGIYYRSCILGQSGTSTCTGTATDFSGIGITGVDSACANLNSSSFGGRTDWRLPTILELQYLGPIVPSQYLTGPLNWFVSSTVDPNNTTRRMMYESIRTLSSCPTTPGTCFTNWNQIRVVCVAGTNSFTPNWLDNNNNTITERSTGLIFQKCAFGRTFPGCTGTPSGLSWQAAMANCANLSLAGRVWRLPNANELRLVNDVTNATGANSVFSDIAINSDQYFTSTPTVDGSNNMNIVIMKNNNSFNILDQAPSPTNPTYARCVTGP